jgi:hypothetical protein
MANASGFRGQKQTNGYFVPLANCVASVFQYNGASGAGGSFLPGNFTRADWSTPGNAASAGALLSTISSIGQGGLLRDMGRTVVSSNRTFRKVQLITPSSAGGVSGTSTVNGPYFTGYIELGTGNSLSVSNATPAPVAYMPGLL